MAYLRGHGRITHYEEKLPEEAIRKNKWIRIVFKFFLWLTILSIPTHIVIWIAVPIVGSIGSIVASTLAGIVLSFFGVICLFNITFTGLKRRVIKLILAFLVSSFLLLAGYSAEVRALMDLFTGMQLQIGILQYYRDEGNVSRGNANHNYYIKIDSFDSELEIALPASFADEIKLRVNKPIQVGFYKELKQIEHIILDPYDENSKVY